MNFTTCQPSEIAIGHRFTYTPTSKARAGEIAHYRVAAVDVPLSPWVKPGCVRLVADEPEWGNVLITPRSLRQSYGWARDEQATP
jgi:hypothetical protein